MRHGPPGMVSGRGLGEPDVAGIPGKLPAFQGSDYGVPVADLAAGRVYDVGASLHG